MSHTIEWKLSNSLAHSCTRQLRSLWCPFKQPVQYLFKQNLRQFLCSLTVSHQALRIKRCKVYQSMNIAQPLYNLQCDMQNQFFLPKSVSLNLASPYWLINVELFRKLSQSSTGTQKAIVTRALTLPRSLLRNSSKAQLKWPMVQSHLRSPVYILSLHLWPVRQAMYIMKDMQN